MGLACLVRALVGGLVLREGQRHEPLPRRRTARAPLRDRASGRSRSAARSCSRRSSASAASPSLFLHERARALARRRGRRARRHAGARGRGPDRRRPLVGHRRPAGSGRCGRSRSAAVDLVALTAALLDAPLGVLIPVLVAAGVLLDELEQPLVRGRGRARRPRAERRRRSGCSRRPQRAGRRLPGALRRARRRDLVARSASSSSRSSRSPAGACCEHWPA